MATYYVDGTNGNDANDGLSVDNAKATIGAAEALVSSPGDIIHIAPGRYVESVTVSVSGSQAGGVIEWRGDPYGKIFGRVGVVRLTGKTNDTDATAAIGSLLICDAVPDLVYRKWTNIVFGETNSYTINWDSVNERTMEGIVFENCVFAQWTTNFPSSSQLMRVEFGASTSAPVGDGPRWRNCVFWVPAGADIFNILVDNNDTGNVDLDWAFENCLVIGGNGTDVLDFGSPGSSGSAYSVYGFRFFNCTFFNITSVVRTSHVKLDGPISYVTIEDCLLVGVSTIISTTGTVSYTNGAFNTVERRNTVLAIFNNPWGSSVDTDANTQMNHSILPGFVLDTYWRNGFGFNPFASFPFSPAYLRDHYDIPGLIGSGSTLTTDIVGNPRETAGIPNAGAYQVSGYPEPETTVVPTGQDDALRFEDQGWFDTFHEVDGSAITVAVQARKDANYTGNEPAIEVYDTDGSLLGSDALTVTADTWEELSVAATPASAGVIRVRRRSRDTSATGLCYFGEVSIS